MQRRILIVDDERDFATGLRLGLKHAGLACDVYTDPSEAVRNFRAGVYDLVLCDVRMPQMNGFAVFRELRAIDKNVRVCFITAFDVHESEFSRVFPQVDVVGFLRKPVTMQAIMAQVQQAVSSQENGRRRPETQPPTPRG